MKQPNVIPCIEVDGANVAIMDVSARVLRETRDTLAAGSELRAAIDSELARRATPGAYCPKGL